MIQILTSQKTNDKQLNIGDEIYFISNGCPRKEKIDKIEMEEITQETIFKYYVLSEQEYWVDKHFDVYFKSSSELIDYVKMMNSKELRKKIQSILNLDKEK